MLDGLIVIVLLLVIAGLAPVWPDSRNWGRAPAGLATALLAAFVVFWYVVPVVVN